MQRYVNPKEFIEAQKKKLEADRERELKFPERPERDVLLFLIEHAPLENWERDVLAMIREESYYFSPQAQTKVMNEGWACVEAGTPVFTDTGLVPMRSVVAGGSARVSDGTHSRAVYDRNVIRDHPTVRIRTRRGLELCGSTNHRILAADGRTWRRLDELVVGDALAVAGGAGLWPEQQVRLHWQPCHRVSLSDVAQAAGVSLGTVLRHRAGRAVRRAGAVDAALDLYEEPANQELPQAVNKRAGIRVPTAVDERLAGFLGFLVGDGHISRAKRHLGLTTGDDEQAQRFSELAVDLFGVRPVLKRDGNRWRVLVHSESVSDFLVTALGLCFGPSASSKTVPETILRSPRDVVTAFLRAYFDCDGYAGKQGVILSSASEAMTRQVQLLLLNLGILSRRRRQTDGCTHLHVSGRAAARFRDIVGFGLDRKQQALADYVDGHVWFKDESWTDEVVGVETGRADVYDISVDETHRYAAAGFVNHNSFWHTTIMTQKALDDSELIDYADRHAGTMGVQPGSINPYKLGLELFRDIEDRWNKGRFGKEWDDCDNLSKRKHWDTGAGLGREKIYEVRRHYNDVTFIDEFLTIDFVREHKLFVYGFNKKSGNWEITDRDFKAIKNKLLFSLTNFGQPFIQVVDGNFENRGELLLKHLHEGVDLRQDYMRDTLANVQAMWTRPVSVVTRIDDRMVLVTYDGEDFTEREIETEP
jgi:stage V sporulation protein R